MPSDSQQKIGESPYSVKPTSAHRERTNPSSRASNGDLRNRPKSSGGSRPKSSGQRPRSKASTAEKRSESGSVTGEEQSEAPVTNGDVNANNVEQSEAQNGSESKEEHRTEDNANEDATTKKDSNENENGDVNGDIKETKSDSKVNTTQNNSHGGEEKKVPRSAASSGKESQLKSSRQTSGSSYKSSSKDSAHKAGNSKPPSGSSSKVSARSKGRSEAETGSRKSGRTESADTTKSKKSQKSADSAERMTRIGSSRRRNGSGTESKRSYRYDMDNKKTSDEDNKENVKESVKGKSEENPADDKKEDTKSGSENSSDASLKDQSESDSKSTNSENKQQQSDSGKEERSESAKESAKGEETPAKDTDPKPHKNDVGSQTDLKKKEDTGTQCEKRPESDRKEKQEQPRKTSVDEDSKDGDSIKGKKKRKPLPPEIKAVSKIVSYKLEDYMNCEKRRLRFDPEGAFRTNKKMAKYDLAYKILEYTVFDKDPTKEKKEKELISPRLVSNSRRVTTSTEAGRLSAYAREVMGTTPVPELSTLHRYRPHCAVENSPDTGKVQNYNRHMGTALHMHNYIYYYKREGLHTGNPEKSERFKRLKMKKEEDEDDKTEENGNSTESSSTTKDRSSNNSKDRQKQQGASKSTSAKPATSNSSTDAKNRLPVVGATTSPRSPTTSSSPRYLLTDSKTSSLTSIYTSVKPKQKERPLSNGDIKTNGANISNQSKPPPKKTVIIVKAQKKSNVAWEDYQVAQHSSNAVAVSQPKSRQVQKSSNAVAVSQPQRREVQKPSNALVVSQSKDREASRAIAFRKGNSKETVTVRSILVCKQGSKGNNPGHAPSMSQKPSNYSQNSRSKNTPADATSKSDSFQKKSLVKPKSAQDNISEKSSLKNTNASNNVNPALKGGPGKKTSELSAKQILQTDKRRFGKTDLNCTNQGKDKESVKKKKCGKSQEEAAANEEMKRAKAKLAIESRLKARSNSKRPPSSQWTTSSGSMLIDVREDDDYTNDFETCSDAVESFRSDLSTADSKSRSQSMSNSRTRSARSDNRSASVMSPVSEGDSQSRRRSMSSKSPSEIRSQSPSEIRSNSPSEIRSEPPSELKSERSKSTARSGTNQDGNESDASVTYSDDFEAESQKSEKEPDAISVQTYASVEHAVDISNEK